MTSSNCPGPRPRSEVSESERKPEGISRPPPPVIYLAFLIAGLLVNSYYQIPLSSGTIILWILGAGILLGGLTVGASALNAMRRARVSPIPWKDPPKLVVDGPFRFSRNPLYVSLAVMYIGISVAANSIWPLILLPLAIVIVDRRVIVAEEKLLEKKFGENYRNYKSRVRRWL